MKIIEAMKQVKDLLRKAEDLRTKIRDYAADLDLHTPTYGNQKKHVLGWLVAHEGITKQICHLRHALQRTNSTVEVTIELGGKQVTKTISEWIFRRTQLAALDRQAWESLGTTEKSGRLKEGFVEGVGSEAPKREIKIRRYYDPLQRDERVELYASEPSLIDGRLEVVNAITDLTEG